MFDCVRLTSPGLVSDRLVVFWWTFAFDIRISLAYFKLIHTVGQFLDRKLKGNFHVSFSDWQKPTKKRQNRYIFFCSPIFLNERKLPVEESFDHMACFIKFPIINTCFKLLLNSFKPRFWFGRICYCRHISLSHLMFD